MSKKKVVCFDMDGVIATGTVEDVYSHEAGWAYEKCVPLHKTIKLMSMLHRSGVHIVIHTARWEKDRKKTEEWLKAFRVPYDELILGKPSAAVYIDDRNYPIGYKEGSPTKTYRIVMEMLR